MAARQRMTMRTTIERDQATADPYGSPGPPDWQTLESDVPCYVWAEAARKMISDTQTVTLDHPGAIVPLGTDITEEDRLASITDRRGTQLFPLFYVDAVMRRKDHLELRLRDYD